jgi:hypothetical protein
VSQVADGRSLGDHVNQKKSFHHICVSRKEGDSLTMRCEEVIENTFFMAR